MSLLGGRRIIGAFVCPRGAFAIECTRSAAGIEVARSMDVPHALRSPVEAADHLVGVLQSAGIANADVSVSLRGFGVAHHTLQLPPARDELLDPIIEREMRRLEPQLGDCVVSRISLPALDTTAAEATPQRSFFAAVAPRDTIQAFEERLAANGHRLAHLTALPVGMQRLLEQFDSGTGTTATVTPLPDGAFIGFSLDGGLRLIVEPPLPPDTQYETAALAEEVDLGAMFVRQQFRGMNLDRVVLIGALDSLFDLKPALTEKLRIPVKQLDFGGVSPADLAALGAVLDQQSPAPLSLGGETRRRVPAQPRSRLETASLAAVLALALVGGWTVFQTVRAERAESALATAQKRIEQDSFGLQSLRATADQRRMVQNALTAVRIHSTDRVALQEILAGVAALVRAPIRLDSMRLGRGESAWKAVVGGSVTGLTNARAVQTLHDLYREIPQRLTVDSLRLDELSYADETVDFGVSAVRFRISFEVPSAAARKE